MANKIVEPKRQLFSPGRVMITAEAFQRLKELGVDPRQLVDRHTRGDWDESPVDWMVKSHARLQGNHNYCILSAYRLDPSKHSVSVGTSSDLSETSIHNWPDGKFQAPEYPLESMEAGYQATKRPMEKSFARNLLNGTAPKVVKPKPKPRGKGWDIAR